MTRHAVELHQPPRPSGRASPDFAFGWERFSDVAREIAPLFVRHAAEADEEPGKPIDPDWDRLFALDLAGILRILTVRHNGLLIGYVFNFVLPSLRRSTELQALVEGIWLDPVYREGLTGYKMIVESDRGLRAMGVKSVRFEVPSYVMADRGTIGKLLKRAGYRLVGHVYFRSME